jgi:hypothetical protein
MGETRQSTNVNRNHGSTVAQMFSQELMDIFRIDNSVADLDKEVDKRSVVARPPKMHRREPRQQRVANRDATRQTPQTKC